MKTGEEMQQHRSNDRRNRAFNRIELIVIILAFGLLAGLAWAYVIHKRERITRIKCIGNLKNIALGLKVFASDNGDRFPYRVRPPILVTTPNASIWLTNTTVGRTDSNAVWAHFLIASNYLGSPKVLLCPGNRAKRNGLERQGWAGLSRPQRIARNESAPRSSRIRENHRLRHVG